MNYTNDANAPQIKEKIGSAKKNKKVLIIIIIAIIIIIDIILFVSYKHNSSTNDTAKTNNYISKLEIDEKCYDDTVKLAINSFIDKFSEYSFNNTIINEEETTKKLIIQYLNCEYSYWPDENKYKTVEQAANKLITDNEEKQQFLNILNESKNRWENEMLKYNYKNYNFKNLARTTVYESPAVVCSNNYLSSCASTLGEAHVDDSYNEVACQEICEIINNETNNVDNMLNQEFTRFKQMRTENKLLGPRHLKLLNDQRTILKIAVAYRVSGELAANSFCDLFMSPEDKDNCLYDIKIITANYKNIESCQKNKEKISRIICAKHNIQNQQ